jgi:hypothetical protein
MRLRIKANTIATVRWMEVDSYGVTFCETAFTGGKRRFRFHDIDLVLMSPDNVLAFQVGQEVFSLPVKPKNKKHQRVIDALLAGVCRV